MKNKKSQKLIKVSWSFFGNLKNEWVSIVDISMKFKTTMNTDAKNCYEGKYIEWKQDLLIYYIMIWELKQRKCKLLIQINIKTKGT